MLRFQEFVVLLEFDVTVMPYLFKFILHLIVFCRIMYCRRCTLMFLYIVVLLICVRIIVSGASWCMSVCFVVVLV